MSQNEQLLFDFAEPEKDRKNQVFDSEDDALDALLSVAPVQQDHEEPAAAPVVPEDDYVSGVVSPAESVPVESVPAPQPEPVSPVEIQTGDASGSSPDPVSPLPSVEEEEPVAVSAPVREARCEDPFALPALRLAALAFLTSRQCSAAALKVPSSLGRFSFDAASFSLEPKLRSTFRIRSSAIALAVNDLRSVQPDAVRHEQFTAELNGAMVRQSELELEIRTAEPELGDSPLLGDSQTWDYSRSRNPEYRKILRRVRMIQAELSKLDRFARIAAAHSANEYFLILPDTLGIPADVPEGWGIVSVSRSLAFTLAREPAFDHAVSEEQQLFLALKIAASAAPDTLFAHGISAGPDGAIDFFVPPKRRRSLRFRGEA